MMILNKTRNNDFGDTYNITKNSYTFNTTDNQCFTRNHTSNITHNITRHNHNNYEHNVIQKVNQHIKRISNDDTEMNCFLYKFT